MAEEKARRAVSDETRAKMRAARLGKKHSMETRAKLLGNKFAAGNKPSDETRAKRSAAMTGNKLTAGLKHSEESRAKMSASQLGRKHSAETRAKISAASLGRPLGEKRRAQMRSVANRGSASPRWGKPPAHGKRIEHKGHVFRSSYEVRCADALDRKGIKWEYEPRRFDLGDCTYLPDFYLPEHGVYWEVKGWLGPDSQRKINRFRQVHPDIPLVVVTDTVLKLMEA